MASVEEAALGYVRGDVAVAALKFDQLEVAKPGTALRSSTSEPTRRVVPLKTFDAQQYLVRYDPEISVEPEEADVALGMLRRRHNEAELREWAFLMLALPVIDASNLQTERGDKLLAALHSASFGESPEPEVWTIAQSLVEQDMESER